MLFVYLTLLCLLVCGGIGLVSALKKKQVEETRLIQDRRRREAAERDEEAKARRDAEARAQGEWEQRWNTLVKYDASVRAAYEKVSEIGPAAQNELRQAFAVFNDPGRIPEIADQIVADFRSGKLSLEMSGTSVALAPAAQAELTHKGTVIAEIPGGGYEVKGKRFDTLQDAKDYIDMMNW